MDLVLDETPIAIGDGEAAAAVLAREAAAQWDRVAPAPDTAAGGFLARARWLIGGRGATDEQGRHDGDQEDDANGDAAGRMRIPMPASC